MGIQVVYDAMEKVEKWRDAEVNSISNSSQIIAFHLACMTEEKFRLAAIKGNSTIQPSIHIHEQFRNDLFSLEWCLRSLRKLPDDTLTRPEQLRIKWNNTILSKCSTTLAKMAHYPTFRDLVITASRGGYLVKNPKPDVIVFEDTPEWNGINDIKNIYISNIIEDKRTLNQSEFNLQNPSRNDTSSHEDFPHNINTSYFKSSEFWEVYNYLFKISVNDVRIKSRIKKRGRSFRTSDTSKLTIIKVKNSLVRELSRNIDLTPQTVKSILKWITFNDKTDRKLSLFHCSLIELNRCVYLILPHSLILSHPTTLFLRLLAKFDKSSYDAISTKKEKKKLSEIASHLHSVNSIELTNRIIGFQGTQNEIDLIQHNKVENIVNIAQAKIIIRPDTVAEVDNANKSILAGVKQLESNKKLLEAGGIKVLLKKLGLSENMIDPKINYFLMITNFTGSDFLDIPEWVNVMPIEYCLLPSEKAKTLDQIYSGYKVLWDSLDNKVETSKTSETFEIAGFKVSYPGFLI